MRQFFFILIALLLSINYYCDSSTYIFRFITIRNSVDHYAWSFTLLLTVVSICVYVWSYYYLDSEANFERFSLLLLSFLLRILILIFFSNLFMTLLGWDALGVTSFLLIVFYKNRKCLSSGIITALTNRIGDCLLFCMLGLFLFSSRYIMTMLTVWLSFTKRAQIPFSSWLPAAMAAPTPVSALVHSSTLVTAGIYVLIRYSFLDGSTILLFGRATLLLAGWSACGESDLKKVVALSTLSQLGVIIVSLGAYSKSYCFFHLISHACFKALLFMCVGVCIHSIYGTQEYRNLNLVRSAPTVGVMSSVAVLSLMGFPFTSGYYRKDSILEHLFAEQLRAFFIMFFVLGVILTSCYSIKIIGGIFLLNIQAGKPSQANGGFSIAVKVPLFLMGRLSVWVGVLAENYRGILNLVLDRKDKFLPIMALGMGVIMSRKRISSPYPSSMILLTPLTQYHAISTIPMGKHQFNFDKGAIRTISISFIAFNSLLIRHSIRMGLFISGMFILFLY